MELTDNYRKQSVPPRQHLPLICIAAITIALILFILTNRSATEISMKNKVQQAVSTANIVAGGLFADDSEPDAEKAFKNCLMHALLAYAVGENRARLYESYCASDAITDEYNSELGYSLAVKAPCHEELSKKALSRYAALYQPIYRTDDINVYIVIDRVRDALMDGKLSS